MLKIQKVMELYNSNYMAAMYGYNYHFTDVVLPDIRILLRPKLGRNKTIGRLGNTALVNCTGIDYNIRERKRKN